MNNINIKQLESRLISAQQVNKHIVETKQDFNQILEKIQNKDIDIKFSKHATER